jgi:hypothetical protein
MKIKRRTSPLRHALGSEHDSRRRQQCHVTMPPVPPANRSHKGTGDNTEVNKDTSKKKGEVNTAEQGDTANITQNTTNAGFFKGRRVKYSPSLCGARQYGLFMQKVTRLTGSEMREQQVLTDARRHHCVSESRTAFARRSSSGFSIRV